MKWNNFISTVHFLTSTTQRNFVAMWLTSIWRHQLTAFIKTLQCVCEYWRNASTSKFAIVSIIYTRICWSTLLVQVNKSSGYKCPLYSPPSELLYSNINRQGVVVVLFNDKTTTFNFDSVSIKIRWRHTRIGSKLEVEEKTDENRIDSSEWKHTSLRCDTDASAR